MSREKQGRKINVAFPISMNGPGKGRNNSGNGNRDRLIQRGVLLELKVKLSNSFLTNLSPHLLSNRTPCTSRSTHKINP